MRHTQVEVAVGVVRAPVERHERQGGMPVDAERGVDGDFIEPFDYPSEEPL